MIISLNVAFDGKTYSTNIEKQNPGLQAEVESHEHGHEEQILEAASLPINLQVTIDGNIKTYPYRPDNAMKAAIRDFYVSTMYRSMTPADQQLFIQNNIANPGISQMLSNVNKIQSIPHQDVEDDANIRVLKQAQSNGQSMPYTTKQQSINFNGQTIK